MDWQEKPGGFHQAIAEKTVDGVTVTLPAPGVLGGSMLVRPSRDIFGRPLRGIYGWVATTKLRSQLGQRKAMGTAPDVAGAKERAEQAYVLLLRVAELEVRPT